MPTEVVKLLPYFFYVKYKIIYKKTPRERHKKNIEEINALIKSKYKNSVLFLESFSKLFISR